VTPDGPTGASPRAVIHLRPWADSTGGTSGTKAYLWCPACDDLHGIEVGPGGWTWDGNADAPTTAPSIRVGGVQWGPEDAFFKPSHHVGRGAPTVCHSFVRSGVWEFLGDCTHDLAGQKVPCVPFTM